MKNVQLSFFAGARAPGESHANRGMDFERALNDMHELYHARSLALISKQFVPALPVKDGIWAKVIGKATVDYTGLISGGRLAAFDAKDCANGRIELDRLAPHQQTYLSDVRALGGIAFVLVRFNRKQLFAVPIRVWDLAVAARTAGCEGEFDGWKTTGKASINISEMRPEWEVMDYDWLKTVKGWETK